MSAHSGDPSRGLVRLVGMEGRASGAEVFTCPESLMLC